MHCAAQKPAPGAKPIFDGKWWAASFAEERSGYLNGYLDCYIYDAKAKSNSGGSTIADFSNAIDEYYRTHRPTAPVSTALKQIDRTAKPHPVPEGGEKWTEPHGYYDGLWWRGGSPEEQLGYVEGYLSCYSSEVLSSGAVFSKTAAQYRALVNKFLDGHSKSDDEKVAHLLRRFRDQPRAK